MLDVSRYVLYFFTYAFLGWCCEVIYCSIPQKKLVNRGYLYAPICPIYGYGAVIVLLAFYWLTKYPWGFIVVALGGFFLTTLLEYITSLVMEKLFHMRWWDYSHHKFNINGRVCLLNSTMFMILTLFVCYGIHPLIESGYNSLGNVWIYALAAVLFTEMLIDTVFSTIKVVGFANLIRKSEDIISSKVTAIKSKYNMENLERAVKSLANRFPTMRVVKEKLGLVHIKEYFSKLFNKDKE